jgi:hypothetical protein
MIAASNSRVISFDNLSGIPQWLSDALCRLSTGGGFATRELHTDTEEILFDATRPIILNGIEDIVSNADLADRSLIVTLPQVEEEDRVPEKVLMGDFLLVWPRILGSLLDAVSMALRNLDQINLPQLPRMADFTRWICAAVPALPFSEQDFLRAYAENRRESVSVSIEASSIAPPIQDLAAAGYWEGTATELLRKLNERVPEDIRKDKSWPQTPAVLSNKLRRIAPVLRQTGFSVAFETRGHSKTKFITLGKKAGQTSDRSARNDAFSKASNDLSAVAESESQPADSDRNEQSATAQTDLRPQEKEQ